MDLVMCVHVLMDGMVARRTAHFVINLLPRIIHFDVSLSLLCFSLSSSGQCPTGIAWADKAYATDAAHQVQECSNAGICDRTTGTCDCFPGYGGSSCQRGECTSFKLAKVCLMFITY